MVIVSKIVTVYCFQYKDHMELKGANLSRLKTVVDKSKQEFEITGANGKKLQISAKSNKKSSNWQKTFEEVLSRLNDKVFGTPLNDLIEREGCPVPRIVFTIFYRLNKSLTEDKVFRTAGDSGVIRSLQRRFNQVFRDVDLSNSPAQDVAALLVTYMDRLPQRLLSLDIKDPIFSSDKDPSTQELLDFARATLQENRSKGDVNATVLFQYLCTWLGRFIKVNLKNFEQTMRYKKLWESIPSRAFYFRESYHTLNAFRSNEICVIFANLLIKPTRHSLSFCYRIPRVLKLLIAILESPDKVLFSGETVLPSSIDELLLANQVGNWWNDLRIESPYIIEWLLSGDHLQQIVNAVVVPPRSHFAGEGGSPDQRDVFMQKALSAALALTLDSVRDRFFAKDSALFHYFFEKVPLLFFFFFLPSSHHALSHHQTKWGKKKVFGAGQNAGSTSEESNGLVRDILQSLFDTHTEMTTNFFSANPRYSMILLQSLNSGNLRMLVLSLANLVRSPLSFFLC